MATSPSHGTRTFKRGLAAGLTTERLKVRSNAVRKEKRADDFKRFRQGADGDGGGGGGAVGGTCDEDALRRAIALVQSNDSKAVVMEGLLTLRQHLCSSDFTPIQAIVESGIVGTFVTLLACNDEDLVTEIVWCLTNIATGDHLQTGEVLRATPALQRILDDPTGRFSVTLQEQVCWTLGNVAGDSDEHRQVLLQHGVLQSLAGFLLKTLHFFMQPVAPTAASSSSGTGASDALAAVADVSSALSRAGTASWALSNLARGSTRASLFIDSGVVPPLIGLMRLAEQQRQQQVDAMGCHAGTATALVSAPAVAAMRALMVEVSWIFVFLVAKEEDAVHRLIEEGLVEAAVAVLVLCIGGGGAEGGVTPLAVPALRCVGNIGAGPAQWQGRLMASSDSLVPALVALSDVRTVEPEVVKEALWVVATLAAPSLGAAATGHPSGLDQLIAHLMEALVSDQFDLQREAVLAIELALFSVAGTVSSSGAPSSSPPVCRAQQRRGSRLLAALLARGDAVRRLVELLRVADADVNMACMRILREVAEADCSYCACDCCGRGSRLDPRGSKLVSLLRGVGAHEALDDIQYGPGAPDVRQVARDLAEDLFEVDDDDDGGEEEGGAYDAAVYGPGTGATAGGVAQYTFGFDGGPTHGQTFTFGQQQPWDGGIGGGSGGGGVTAGGGFGFGGGTAASAGRGGMGRGAHLVRPAWMN